MLLSRAVDSSVGGEFSFRRRQDMLHSTPAPQIFNSVARSLVLKAKHSTYDLVERCKVVVCWFFHGIDECNAWHFRYEC
jgi:hypothetical protein